MMVWFWPVFLITVSVLAMGKGSDWVTDALIPVARRLGISASAAGLILVAIVVSLPEVLVAGLTLWAGHPAISLGVILGSIICNIGLMTGLPSLIRPLRTTLTTILRDGMFSIVIPILLLAVSVDGTISRLDGFSFLLLFIPYLVNVVLVERRLAPQSAEKERREIATELELVGFELFDIPGPWLQFIVGAILLIGGAHLFSDQLIGLVTTFGWAEVAVGAVLGALGPSLPNIISAWTATSRGLDDVAVAETLGSNIFTMLVTLGFIALLAPVTLTSQWLRLDLPLLIIMSFLLFLFLVTKKEISRFEGAVLLVGYLVSVAIQVMVG